MILVHLILTAVCSGFVAMGITDNNMLLVVVGMVAVFANIGSVLMRVN